MNDPLIREPEHGLGGCKCAWEIEVSVNQCNWFVLDVLDWLGPIINTTFLRGVAWLGYASASRILNSALGNCMSLDTASSRIIDTWRALDKDDGNSEVEVHVSI